MCTPKDIFGCSKTDAVFDYYGAVTEAKRAKAFYAAEGVPENFSFNLWDGGHTFDENSGTFQKFFDAIKEN